MLFQDEIHFHVHTSELLLYSFTLKIVSYHSPEKIQRRFSLQKIAKLGMYLHLPLVKFLTSNSIVILFPYSCSSLCSEQILDSILRLNFHLLVIH